MEALIDATADPDLTCARMFAMRRAELSPELDSHWRYIDELTERSNRRAEHYEAVSHEPAPQSAGRTESERVMGEIRKRAARRPL